MKMHINTSKKIDGQTAFLFNGSIMYLLAKASKYNQTGSFLSNRVYTIPVKWDNYGQLILQVNWTLFLFQSSCSTLLLYFVIRGIIMMIERHWESRQFDHLIFFHYIYCITLILHCRELNDGNTDSANFINMNPEIKLVSWRIISIAWPF